MTAELRVYAVLAGVNVVIWTVALVRWRQVRRLQRVAEALAAAIAAVWMPGDRRWRRCGVRTEKGF